MAPCVIGLWFIGKMDRNRPPLSFLLNVLNLYDNRHQINKFCESQNCFPLVVLFRGDVTSLASVTYRNINASAGRSAQNTADVVPM